MKLTASAFFGLALLLSGNAVWAQEPSSIPAMLQNMPPMTKEEKEAWTYLVFEEVLQRSCEDPTLASAIALPKPLLNVEVADDNTIVLKGRLGTEMGKQFVASVDVKSPFNSSGETILANQDGLSKGSTLDAKLTWFGWKPDSVYKMIEDEWENRWDIEASLNKEQKITDYIDQPAIRRPSVLTLLDEKKYDELRGKYRNWLRHNQPILPVLTFKAHGEQKDFDFYIPAAGPPAGLKKTSESHQNYYLTGSLGAYLGGAVYASLNYNRGRAYEEGAKKDFCTADSLTGVLSCKSLPLAPPQSQRMETVELEVRALTQSLGFGPHLTRDLQTDVTKVDLPVYLLQKLKTSKMELNLGARLQWRSDTRKYAVSIFLGPTFSSVFRMF